MAGCTDVTTVAFRVMDISGAFRVSDVGLRCVGTRAAGMVDLNLSGCLGKLQTSSGNIRMKKELISV